MTADYRTQAVEDPTVVVQELYRAHAGSPDFPRLVAEHFAKLFESPNAFKNIPALNVHRPPETFRDRALVRFRAMVQDTSLSTEMYLAKHSDGTCGGWGIYEPESASSSSATDVDYANLRECNVLWATSVPAESDWCGEEMDGSNTPTQTDSPSPSSSRAYKYPHPELGHVGIQIKLYERENVESFRASDVVTFVGILSTEPCGLDQTQDILADAPTLHVLFTKSHAPNVVPRPFPRVSRSNRDGVLLSISSNSPATPAEDTAQIREELIAWIADEALGGDRHAAEWILLSCIARVQSRHPPLLPPPLVVSHFPPPPPVPSTVPWSAAPLPTLSAVLGLLLPLSHTLSLSLDSLNKSTFTPESKDEDLHAGVLQLPQGTVLLVSEGGVREGQLLERGVLNVRALQEVMDAQTLAYVFPFSRFAFPTDIACVVLAEGRRSAFFRAELSVPLRASPAAVAALYKPREAVKVPPREKLDAFRDLVVGARGGTVVVPEGTSEHIQAQFVSARQDDRSVTPDDLIRWMTVSKLYALSLHEPTLSVETWQRAKAFDDQRRALVV
ncbi:mini-chromosome maintenance replisome factor-domain-containing protein [Dichomitus squalens]|uniref:Mini-chromosome maintenance replisome factor-domain-containing protein n=1 Tax=Dichomitus squalens TaxID=114155 RepID=A0A4Q9MRQ0_9APHY|nr:mini-chromosome maintenance replisome factor-domain-containing protein [Dichomitus squalens]